jgi:TatD DNase family protein
MNSNAFFDAHCHLRVMTGDDAVKPVCDMAICAMVCCGTSPADWEIVQQVADGAGTTAVIPAYGLHPWFLPSDAGADAALLARLSVLLEADPRAAVGEIGLDFARSEGVTRVRQRALLVAQLALAQRLGRVAIIHCVRAWGALVKTLEAVGPLPRGFVLHAYAGSADMVPPLARLGAFFSFTAIAAPLVPKAAVGIRAVPPERLLLESDLHLGARTSCAAQRQRLDAVAGQLATATGMTLEHVIRLTADNARRCFGG